MNKLRISVSVNRKAAALRGLILGETVQIEVGPEDLSPENWQYLISQLNADMTKFPFGDCEVSGPELSDFIQALEACRAKETAQKAASQARAQEVRQAYLDSLEKMAAVLEANRMIATSAELVPVKITFVWEWISNKDREHFKGLSFDGFEAPKLEAFPWVSLYGLNNQDRAPVELLQAAQQDAIAVLKERVLAANLEALEKARPQLEIAARERDEAKAIADAKELEERKALYAGRLATGIWEKETPEYNSKRYSPYWCAKVTFPSGPKAVYEFGASTGKWGEAGILSLKCKPGEIIAWGQKDLRRADRSEHHILVMREDGGMVLVADKVDAYKLWQAAQKA